MIARKVSHCSKTDDAFGAFTSVIRTLARLSAEVDSLCGVFSGAVHARSIEPLPAPHPLINYLETFTRVAKGEAIKAMRSDFGALSLKCDPWNITLERLDQSSSSQSDYKGVIYADGQGESHMVIIRR